MQNGSLQRQIQSARRLHAALCGSSLRHCRWTHSCQAAAREATIGVAARCGAMQDAQQRAEGYLYSSTIEADCASYPPAHVETRFCVLASSGASSFRHPPAATQLPWRPAKHGLLAAAAHKTNTACCVPVSFAPLLACNGMQILASIYKSQVVLMWHHCAKASDKHDLCACQEWKRRCSQGLSTSSSSLASGHHSWLCPGASCGSSMCRCTQQQQRTPDADTGRLRRCWRELAQQPRATDGSVPPAGHGGRSVRGQQRQQ